MYLCSLFSCVIRPGFDSGVSLQLVTNPALTTYEVFEENIAHHVKFSFKSEMTENKLQIFLGQEVMLCKHLEKCVAFKVVKSAIRFHKCEVTIQLVLNTFYLYIILATYSELAVMCLTCPQLTGFLRRHLWGVIIIPMMQRVLFPGHRAGYLVVPWSKCNDLMLVPIFLATN